jgi:molybdenum-dependent DNA-binding transcriptional regulator ModE
MTDLAELVVRIRADASALERELKKAGSVTTREVGGMDKALTSLKRQFVGLLPAITVAGVVAFAKNATLAADRLNDLSARTGVAATTLSAFSLPLKQSGSSVEEFASSLNRMNNAIGEAANNDTAAQNFTAIGLSIQDLMAMSPEQQFEAIAKALNEIDNQAEFTNKGMAIFGRQFSSIAPLIRETNGEMDTFIKRQQELGVAFTESDLKLVDDFWDAMEGRIAQAEVAIVRFINNIVNLRSKMREIESDTQIYHAARNAGMSVEQARAMRDKVSTTRPQTVDSITFRTPTRTSTTASTTETVERAAKAQQDYNAHIEAYQREAEKADRATEELSNTLKSKLSGSLTDAIFDAENAGDAFLRLGDSIARSIFERAVAQPLSNGIVDAIGGSGIGSFFSDLLPSFDVGSYNVPNDMMANIHKGEMIVPAKQAEQIRQGGTGGVTVVQNLSFNDSVRGAARDEIMRAAPAIAAAAKDSIFQAIQQGGSASKIVGVR